MTAIYRERAVLPNNVYADYQLAHYRLSIRVTSHKGLISQTFMSFTTNIPWWLKPVAPGMALWNDLYEMIDGDLIHNHDLYHEFTIWADMGTRNVYTGANPNRYVFPLTSCHYEPALCMTGIILCKISVRYITIVIRYTHCTFILCVCMI